jgi:hypothetical protein
VLRAAESPTDHALFLTAALTGMRQGELRALRWRDIDWAARRVRVRCNYVRGSRDAPKTRRGSRAVPLADRLAAELERHYQGSSYTRDDDLVFAHPALGTVLDHSDLVRRFKRALQMARVREVRFHDLRHTFGTRMAGAGVPLRTLQEWMGHRDFTRTLVYGFSCPAAAAHRGAGRTTRSDRRPSVRSRRPPCARRRIRADRRDCRRLRASPSPPPRPAAVGGATARSGPPGGRESGPHGAGPQAIARAEALHDEAVARRNEHAAAHPDRRAPSSHERGQS